MGGKTKQAQRTKNNVRPSSSGRSVEILSKMNLDTGLVISSGNNIPTLFPTLTALSLDSGINPEYQMCMKKLNKKDPITRAKALQELLELVNKSQVEDVVQVLPSWTYFYKILTADTDRKVREMAQCCHGAIVAVCGRQVAPHLKQLLPAWLQAQYDDHAPAQTQAQKSLNSTFPDKKLAEVMSFCKVEVMAHFQSSLVGNTDLTFIKRSDDAEERELQQCRIVTSSLQGLEYFTQHLPEAHDDWLWGELTNLLQTNTFWKFTSNTSQTLRAAWYAALGRVIERFRSTFGEKYGTKCMRLLLGAANEHNSLVAAQLWGCILLFMHNVEDWYKYLDKKNLLSKRILDILENGGWGDAKHLSNILLPLLAHLPEEFLTKEYYESFFTAMFAGLDKKNILSSKSERQFWITSLADCLRYLSIQQTDFVVEVASWVHRTWLEKILNRDENQGKANLMKWSASNMASLVKYWLKQSKETGEEQYDQLVRNFWQNIGSTITMHIDSLAIDNDVISKLVDDHITLIQTLKNSFLQETKKQHSIKFDDNSPKSDDIVSIPNQQCDASIIERYKHNLDLLVELTCLHYFDFMRNKQVCSVVLTPLFTLLGEFDSKALFSAIARQFDVDSVYEFYENVLRTWLSGDTMRCKVLVDVVFLILKHLSEEEQTAVFSSFQQFPPSVVEWCLALALSHPHCDSAAVRSWLRGPVVEAALVLICKRLVAEGDCSRRNLLLMCLSQDGQGELVISSGAVSSVVEIFSAAIGAGGGPALEQCAAHASCLATTLQRHHHSRHYTDLVVNLFQLNILVPRGDSRLSVDTWCEVRSSWQDGLAALDADQKRLFIERAIKIIHQNAFQDKDNIDLIKLEHIVSMCPYLLDREEINEEKIIDYISFTEQIFDFEYESRMIETYALRNDCIISNFNCPFDEARLEPDIQELNKIDLIAYINRVIFRALYLRTMLLLRDDEEKHLCDALLSNEYFEMEFCKLTYDHGIVGSLCEGYTFWVHYSLIEETKKKLTSILETILDEAKEARTGIITRLRRLAATEGFYWATARRWCWVKVQGSGGQEENLPEGFNLEDAVTGNGFIHTLQVNAKHSNDQELIYRTKYLVMMRSMFASDVELPEDARAQVAKEAAECLPTCNVDVIVNAYYCYNQIMLYERDLSDVSWRQVLSNTAIVDFLVEMVEQRGWDAPSHHWDFTTITLCSLISSVEKSKHRWGSTKIAMLTRSALRLFSCVHKFVGGVKAECLRRQPSEHVAHLPTEWADIFAPDLNYNLFNILIYILESSTDVASCSRNHVLAALCAALEGLEWPAPARASPGLQRVAGACTRALARPHHHAYKYVARRALGVVAKPLVLDDAEKLSTWTEELGREGPEGSEAEGGGRARPPLSVDWYEEPLTHLADILMAALSNVTLGEETCLMVVGSDSHSMALGWLLLADAMAAQCALAKGDLAHHYVHMYREKGYAEPLMETSLRLLPAEVFAFLVDNSEATNPPPAQAQLFASTKEFNVYEVARNEDIGALACRCVCTALGGAACAGVRGWWGAAPPRHARLLRRLVRSYVAPHLLHEQFTEVQRRAHQLGNAEVRVHWSSREVVCVFTVDERPLELRLTMSPQHPLVAPSVAALDTGAPGANTHWLALYLAYQNGTAWNALRMWTHAVAAKVGGCAQCYICYCRLHPSTGGLPRAACRQCRNKFHLPCVQKWFTTSKTRNCPLCRGDFYEPARS